MLCLHFFKKGLLQVNYVTSAWKYTNEHPHGVHAFLSFIRFDVYLNPPELSEAAAACESVARRVQQEVLHDCALLPPPPLILWRLCQWEIVTVCE